MSSKTNVVDKPDNKGKLPDLIKLGAKTGHEMPQKPPESISPRRKTNQ